MRGKDVENAPVSFGMNLGYILDLHDMYLKDPGSVSEEMQTLFGELSGAEAPAVGAGASHKVIRDVVNLVEKVRAYGHLEADIYPLYRPQLTTSPGLDLEDNDLSEDKLQSLPASLISPYLKDKYDNALDAFNALKEQYTGHIAYEYLHIDSEEERNFIQEKIEKSEVSELDNNSKIELFKLLSKVEGFEKYLHKNFVGAKRFSIEGVDTIIPMLDHLLQLMADENIPNLQIGMAHRGRLNVLTHILNKSYKMMLSEFMHQDPYQFVPEDGSLTVTQGWHKDVKYHLGASTKRNDKGIEQRVTLANNPSHLEVVSPVVLGKTRAQQEDTEKSGKPEQDFNKALAVLIHGDSAMPGQGVVYETLNLSRLNGYKVGGSIHIVANNRLGFTTEERDSRSTTYATSNALGFDIPVIHVNADEPEAAIRALKVALEYRQTFNKDCIIDVIGYRRHGHNEMDEPTATNPMLYQEVKAHATIEEKYGQKLVDEGVISESEYKEIMQEVHTELREVQNSISKDSVETDFDLLAPEEIIKGHDNEEETISLERLTDINNALLEYPEEFNVFKKLRNVLEKRRKPFDNNEEGIDWAHAEALAFATINQDGTPIRLTGQDSERGTFAHRHAVLHNEKTGETLYPLHKTPDAKATFDIYNSPLSEAAVVGFDYGYNLQNPKAMVIWEAQFGDFANMAQVYFDNFIFSSNSKWGEASGMVFFLPHAQEGQGPEHSSARLERFLNLAAESNMTVANLTSTANYFYLLRRQAKYLGTDIMRPLVLMSPKSLLRNQMVASPVEAFTKGKFEEIIVEEHDQSKVKKVLIASGKMAVDLMNAMKDDPREDTALIRLEQLFPFPSSQLQEVFEGLEGLEEIRFVQEEPQNMGAYQFALPLIQEIAPEDTPVKYVGRIKRASPAEGSNEAYKIIQEKIIKEALD